MCGIFAWIGNTKQSTPNLATLRRIALVTEQRGRHAFGWSWLDTSGRLHAYRQPGAIGQSLDKLEMLAEARALIGHCRYATAGHPSHNVNNHPHPVDGGWLVHNGIIGNAASLAQRHELAPSSDCDSEALALLIERLPGTIARRAIQAAQLIPKNPLAALALWRSPGRLVAVRSGNPLSIALTAGGTYLASLPQDMPRGAESVADNTCLVWRLGHLVAGPQVKHFERRHAPAARTPHGAAGRSTRLLVDRWF